MLPSLFNPCTCSVYAVVCVRARSTALNAVASRYARLGWQSVTLDYCTLPIPARPITSAYVCEIAECGSAKATPLLELASKWSHQLACRVRGVCACNCVCVRVATLSVTRVRCGRLYQVRTCMMWSTIGSGSPARIALAAA